MKQFAPVVLALLLTPLAASASTTGYVYVAVPAAACQQASPCAPSQVLVFEGTAAKLVTAIDLPVHTTPRGMVLSRNGVHLYVSNEGTEFGAATSLSVIDARHHLYEAAIALPADAYGELAVRGDDSRVYIAVSRPTSASNRIDAVSTASRVIEGSVAVPFSPSSPPHIAYSVATDDVYALATTLRRYDGGTLAEVASVDVRQYTGPVTASLDGTRLFGNVYNSDAQPLDPWRFRAFDSSTLATQYDVVVGITGLLGIGAVEVPGRDEALFPAANFASAGRIIRVEGFAISSGQLIRNVSLSANDYLAAKGLAVVPDGTRAFLLTERTGSTGQIDVLYLPTNQWAAFTPLARTSTLITSTPPGVQSCSYQLNTAYASFNSAQTVNVPVRLTTDCAWSTTTDQPWVHVDRTSGTGNATITISADVNLTGQTRRATVTIGGQIVTVTQGSPQDATAAFGVIDTPSDGANVSGTIAITGWALDDLAVDTVFIYRDPVPGEPQTQIPVGTATLVEGARPDVQAAYPSFPFASRAGWGYMLLTNMLPASTGGSYRIHVYVADLDRHSTYLGSRTIHVNNAAASLPFGAIDTPGQGEVVSGVITNWGWALTPQPANIPTDGSTIDVVIDGVVVGRPTYGFNRADIAALFPGYANTNSAVGYFTIDTRTLSNGVHTIAWVVRDSLGRAQGIGSRYFTVQNP